MFKDIDNNKKLSFSILYSSITLKKSVLSSSISPSICKILVSIILGTFIGIGLSYAGYSLGDLSIKYTLITGAITFIGISTISRLLLIFMPSKNQERSLQASTPTAKDKNKDEDKIFRSDEEIDLNKSSLIPVNLENEEKNVNRDLENDDVKNKKIAASESLYNEEIERKEIKMNKFFYAAENDQTCERVIEEYSQLVKKQGAQELLLCKAKQAGDYTFFRNSKGNFEFYIFFPTTVYSSELQDPTREDEKNTQAVDYGLLYQYLKHPILPDGCKNSSSDLHSIFMRNKFIHFYKILDKNINILYNSKININKFFNWLNKYNGTVRLNPSLFFTVLGHHFGLRGKYTYTHPTPIKKEYEIVFEGFNNSLGRKIFVEDILDDVDTMQLKAETAKKLRVMYKNAYAVDGSTNPDPKKLVELLNDKNSVSIFTGWKGHSVSLVLTQTHLMYINKGEGSGGNPGMHLYSIHQKIDEGLLSQILSFNKSSNFPQGNNLSNPHVDLNQILKLKYEKTYPLSSQKSGTCVYANNIMSFLAGIILLEDDYRISEEVYQRLKKLFKSSKQRMREKWLGNFFTLMDKKDKDSDLNRIYCLFLLILVLKWKCKKEIYTRQEKECDMTQENGFMNKIKGKCKDLHTQQPGCPYLESLLACIDVIDFDIFAITKALQKINVEDSRMVIDTLSELSGYYSKKIK